MRGVDCGWVPLWLLIVFHFHGFFLQPAVGVATEISEWDAVEEPHRMLTLTGGCNSNSNNNNNNNTVIRCGILRLGSAYYINDTITGICKDACFYVPPRWNLFFRSQNEGRDPDDYDCGSCNPPPPTPAPAPTTASITYDIAMDVADIAVEDRQYFRRASERWARIVQGDLPDVASAGLEALEGGCRYPRIIDDVYVCCQYIEIDGTGGVVGRASPRVVRSSPDNATTGRGLPVTGRMRFDTADIEALKAAGNFQQVIEHELAHVLGFGTLWASQGIIIAQPSPPPPTASPRRKRSYHTRRTAATAAAKEDIHKGETDWYYYNDENESIDNTNNDNKNDILDPPYYAEEEDEGNCVYNGTKALAEYKALTGCGRLPTTCGHWSETCLTRELMTPIYNSNTVLSRITVASMADLGYNVSYTTVTGVLTRLDIPTSCLTQCPNTRRQRQLQLLRHQNKNNNNNATPSNKTNNIRETNMDLEQPPPSPRRRLSASGYQRAVADGRATLELESSLRRRRLDGGLTPGTKSVSEDAVYIMYMEENELYSVLVTR